MRGLLNWMRRSVSGAANYAGEKLSRIKKWPAMHSSAGMVARIALYAALTAIFLHIAGLVSLPFWPFTTEGEIFVDSPEIYTRERLVNDRYEQDHWLGKQRERLDRTQSLLTAEIYQSTSAGNTGADDSQTNQASRDEPPEENQHTGFPFQQEFLIRSAIRDSIRQLSLENMLDDRHDLTGNSIYGLKFDTTVVPGNNTRKRAYVRITAKVNGLFQYSREKEWIRSKTNLPYNAWLYLNEDVTFFIKPESDLKYAYELYDGRIGNVETRLNEYVADRYRLIKKESCTEASAVPAEAVAVVLGVPEGRFVIPKQGRNLRPIQSNSESQGSEEGQSGSGDAGGEDKNVPTVWAADEILVPDPWAKFFKLQIKRPVNPADDQINCIRPWFDVSQIWESVYLAPGTERLPGQYRVYNQLDPSGTRLAVINNDQNLSIEAYNSIIPKYPMTNQLYEEAKKRERLVKQPCPTTEIDCQEIFHFSLPSGLFNFIDAIEKVDAYSYALFPKNDVVGVLANI
ncbi:MAG: hypothetical protein GY789_18530 [Hyphomicrobiales bacterium]|nr:hypothetical protein [Hyphomicrobiales bacterium]MCP5000244.1 hypothetical protein [Hyphomicrobiales bacterium]